MSVSGPKKLIFFIVAVAIAYYLGFVFLPTLLGKLEQWTQIGLFLALALTIFGCLHFITKGNG